VARRPEAPGPRLVAGLQPVREAIRVHGARLERVGIDGKGGPRLEAVERFARDQGVSRIERLSRGELDRASGGVSHQGAIAWAPPLVLAPLESVLAAEPALLAVALDGIQDPQNFGAVIRSAVGIAGAAVIWGEHASAPLSTATFRASAGAIEHATLCRVRSLTGALGQAASAGLQVIGLDSQAPRRLLELDLTVPTLLVIGGEHEGLGRGVRRACTELAQLVPTAGVESLNASVAAAIALYEAIRQRQKAQ
jgi:23S rRNA (guanosine2251-2'-O)-methyltransferase